MNVFPAGGTGLSNQHRFVPTVWEGADVFDGEWRAAQAIAFREIAANRSGGADQHSGDFAALFVGSVDAAAAEGAIHELLKGSSNLQGAEWANGNVGRLAEINVFNRLPKVMGQGGEFFLMLFNVAQAYVVPSGHFDHVVVDIQLVVGRNLGKLN